MILIGEEIQILSKVVSAALKDRDPAPLQDIAKKLTEAGADYIDLNVGPAKKRSGYPALVGGGSSRSL